jgi:K+/H+ antiporter YhaU regulatory subunit KhtT
MKHTPLSTHKGIDEVLIKKPVILHEQGSVIAYCHNDNAAEHIVRCVNSHDALVSALKHLWRNIPFNTHHYRTIEQALEAAGERV